MPATFGIVDLFAGPGGLGEGFSSFVDEGHSPFRIGISVEKEASEHRTLTLRAFLREYRARHNELPKQFIDFHAGLRGEPEWAEVDAGAWRMAVEEACCLELGTDSAAEAIEAATAGLRRSFDDTILIGGPPCQAYSLVGRARAKGKRDYVPEKDGRHYLFREYIGVLKRLRPAAFVMENVKGMLSSTIESRLVFELLMEDLSSLGTDGAHVYELRAIRVEDGKASLQEAAQPKDFVVRAEDFGVPQRRHRVIIVGIRSDLAAGASSASIDVSGVPRTVADVIGGLPPLRSGLSRGNDGVRAWHDTVLDAARLLAAVQGAKGDTIFRNELTTVARRLRSEPPPPRMSAALPEGYGAAKDDLLAWLARRKFWQSFTVAGGKLDEKGQSIGWKISKSTFRAIVDSALGLDPRDESPAAKAKRVLPGLRHLEGIVFAARIMVEPASSSQYRDQNRIANVVLPDEPQHAAIMRGETVPPDPVNAPPRKAASVAAPGWQAPAPAWGAAQPSPAAPNWGATPQPAAAPAPAWGTQNAPPAPQSPAPAAPGTPAMPA
ncbi:MAG: DNA cytosine methyltransferase [Gemmobacter sp.]|nr:DNA cytosine methyltransferase [Gemmobacter sp.]